eukprot:5593647-Amphidinium_carterae.1
MRLSMFQHSGGSVLEPCTCSPPMQDCQASGRRTSYLSGCACTYREVKTKWLLVVMIQQKALLQHLKDSNSSTWQARQVAALPLSTVQAGPEQGGQTVLDLIAPELKRRRTSEADDAEMYWYFTSQEATEPKFFHCVCSVPILHHVSTRKYPAHKLKR